MKRVAVIGAGPAGMTAAYELARREGFEVHLFEASSSVGGMARTIELWGHRVDLGPHRFFSKDPRVNDFWHGVIGDEYCEVERLTRIYFRGKFFQYPLKATDALLKLGPVVAAQCVVSYLSQKASQDRDVSGNFEDWVTAAFGRKLYELFFQSYSEKLWGIPCHELDARFASQRIKKFSLGGAFIDMLGLNKGTHHTLVDRFSYPRYGTGMVYELMAERFQQRGNILRLDTPIKGLSRKGTGIELESGEVEPFDEIISTMPLTLLAKSVAELPGEVRSACDELTYRNTILVYLRVSGEDLFDDQWLYIQSPELQVGRITNFSNWSPDLPGKRGETILVSEYWCNEEDELWSGSDSELIELAREELGQTKLAAGAEILEGRVIRIPRCYPVYKVGFDKALAKIVEFIRKELPHIHAIGRYGSFKYNNQDHSILMGLLVAENIADEADHDLWAINTDYEVYHEEVS